MSRRYFAAVLGVGGMGAAALDHLARRGHRVVGLERDRVPSELGSSVGESRVIRKAYFEDRRYVPLLLRAYELWDSLARDAGEQLLRKTGCLNLGPSAHEAIVGVIAAAKEHQLAHEVLDAENLRARFPAFFPAKGDVGVFEADGGLLRVERCTRAHVDRAIRAGAELKERTRVVGVDVNDARALLITDAGERIEAEHLIISAGPHLPHDPALATLATPFPIEVERQVQLWFAPIDRGLAAPPTMPAFIHFTEGRAYYGLPLDTGGAAEPALKVCRHHGGERTSPDALDRTLRASDEDDVRAYVRAHLPNADGPLVRSRVCMYSNTPDQNFVIGHHPHVSRVVVLGGFSGHGYKFAPVVGEIAADLVTKGESSFDLGMFDPGRFSR